LQQSMLPTSLSKYVGTRLNVNLNSFTGLGSDFNKLLHFSNPLLLVQLTAGCWLLANL